AGNYAVTVTDALGCLSSGNIILATNCYNIINGNIFNDLNNNCTFDSGDENLSYASVIATNGTQTFYGYTNGDGTYQVQVNQPGSYTVTANYYSYYGNICGNIVPCGGSTAPVNFSGVGDTVSNINFGFVGSSGFDLTIHPGWTSANPGFDKEFWVMPYNQSFTAFTGAATVVFHYDPSLIYLYSLAPLPVHNATAHTLTWVVNNVDAPYFNWNNRFRNFFQVPASVPISSMLQYDFDITPTNGDCNANNNHLHFEEIVTGSMDPNEKEVSPAGDILQSDSVLTYTIHFQNTGNDTTAFVILLDTLSSSLDPASVRNLASSHNYSEFGISGTGILKWVFNPIFLVDSATNEEASKGFVQFSIKRKNNLPFGTQIKNSAAIYFDYNEPIITNTVQSEIINSVQDISISNIQLMASPNPFSKSTIISVNGIAGDYDFILTNMLGAKVREIKNITQHNFNLTTDGIASGIYLMNVSVNGKMIATKKLVVE
ncbi:MAG: T9SS type A sorting domain-containing protein, partial [Pseudomonadota bacterium]